MAKKGGSSPPPSKKAAASSEPASSPSVLGNLFGMTNGKYFGEPPAYVDKSKKPGYSPLPKPTAWDWVYNALILKNMWGSPNFVWAAVALAVYFLAPYDLSPTSAAAKGPLTLAFFLPRLYLWLGVTQGYNVFFHYTLHWANWAKRPFLPGREYNWDKVLHNIFWSTCGIAIWTGFENVFAYLWATGRLPYMDDAEAFASPVGMLKFAAALVGVPLFREVHFYFAHRLLHMKPIYYLVHSLHHRNQDIEPFAGLSMHPVEHLYYYACVAPSLIAGLTPFAFLWNGVHLLLSPGASHSGWEDHMQSDAFHYFHHRYAECNYAGFGAAALDVHFGTFVGSYADKGEEDYGKLFRYADGKSTLRQVPELQFVLYLAMASACVGLWAYSVVIPGGLELLAPLTKLQISLIAGFGPILVGLPWIGMHGGVSPFNAAAAPIPHILFGNLLCSVPIAYACYLAY